MFKKAWLTIELLLSINTILCFRAKFKVFVERLDYLRMVLQTIRAVAFWNSTFLYQQVTHPSSQSSSGRVAAGAIKATDGAAAGGSPTRKRRSKRRQASGSSRGSQAQLVSSVVSVENHSNEQTNVV